MWISRKKWKAMQDRIEVLEKGQRVRLKTKNFHATTEYFLSDVFGPIGRREKVISGEAEYFPLNDIIQKVADAAGIDLFLEPSKLEVPAQIVAKKVSQRRRK